MEERVKELTAEEMAEDYVKSVIDVDAFDWKIVREIALAHIAGLKAGSQLDKVWQDYDPGEGCYEDTHEGKWVKRESSAPKWHKVADGDLPKEQKEYWCKVFFYESEETFNAFLWFDLGTKDFKFLEEIKEGLPSSFRVKEWCEIPQ